VWPWSRVAPDREREREGEREWAEGGNGLQCFRVPQSGMKTAFLIDSAFLFIAFFGGRGRRPGEGAGA
jgi:hypothetical protein